MRTRSIPARPFRFRLCGAVLGYDRFGRRLQPSHNPGSVGFLCDTAQGGAGVPCLGSICFARIGPVQHEAGALAIGVDAADRPARVFQMLEICLPATERARIQRNISGVHGWLLR
jgi:hypothetical protein